MLNLILFVMRALLSFLSEKRMQELFITIAEKIAASTENEFDDIMVAEIKKKLLGHSSVSETTVDDKKTE